MFLPVLTLSLMKYFLLDWVSAWSKKAPDSVRSPTTPDSDRVIASLGLGADYKRLEFDFSFSRYFMSKIDMDYSSDSSVSYLSATYTPAQYYFGMAISYSI